MLYNGDAFPFGVVQVKGEKIMDSVSIDSSSLCPPALELVKQFLDAPIAMYFSDCNSDNDIFNHGLKFNTLRIHLPQRRIRYESNDWKERYDEHNNLQDRCQILKNLAEYDPVIIVLDEESERFLRDRGLKITEQEFIDKINILSIFELSCVRFKKVDRLLSFKEHLTKCNVIVFFGYDGYSQNKGVASLYHAYGLTHKFVALD